MNGPIYIADKCYFSHWGFGKNGWAPDVIGEHCKLVPESGSNWFITEHIRNTRCSVDWDNVYQDDHMYSFMMNTFTPGDTLSRTVTKFSNWCCFQNKNNLRSGSIFVSLGETFRRDGRNEK